MLTRLHDLQSSDEPLNGRVLATAGDVRDALRALAEREPFMFELCGEHGAMLTVGFSARGGCVQQGPIDGPYSLALSSTLAIDDGFDCFLVAGTPTPISTRYRLTASELEEILATFVETGERSTSVQWEGI